MKRYLIFFFISTAAVWGAAQPVFTDTFSSVQPARWQQNGSIAGSAAGLSATTASGGALIYKPAPPEGIADYEVRATLNLPSSGGSYTVYLRASSDSMAGPQTTGSFYAVELQNPVFHSSGGCTATLALFRSEAGQITRLAAAPSGCRNGMVLRAVVHGSGELVVFTDELLALRTRDVAGIAGAAPGVGVRQTPAGNGIRSVALYAKKRQGPPAAAAGSLKGSPWLRRVDLQWPAMRDAEGAPVWGYEVRRDGQTLGTVNDTYYADETLATGKSYTYEVVAIDDQGTESAALTALITVPQYPVPDPRQTGLRATGTYWGAMGESVDIRSGNLNFTLPLVTAVGRGGWKVPISLHYDSQNWRKDSQGLWQFNRDTGYGYGWRLQAGALIPFWVDGGAFGGFIFADSSGAEYRLDQHTPDWSFWYSRDSTYVTFELNTLRLYFPDGSFWLMNCESSSGEADSMTRYPTVKTPEVRPHDYIPSSD